MDVDSVHAQADGFARAVAAEDSARFSGYLSHELKKKLAKVLGGLPRPIRTAEVLSVTPPEDERCISVTRFNGFRGGVLLQAHWAEAYGQQPQICRAQIVEHHRS
jgi:hypothetical protein